MALRFVPMFRRFALYSCSSLIVSGEGTDFIFAPSAAFLMKSERVPPNSASLAVSCSSSSGEKRTVRKTAFTWSSFLGRPVLPVVFFFFIVVLLFLFSAVRGFVGENLLGGEAGVPGDFRCDLPPDKGCELASGQGRKASLRLAEREPVTDLFVTRKVNLLLTSFGGKDTQRNRHFQMFPEHDGKGGSGRISKSPVVTCPACIFDDEGERSARPLARGFRRCRPCPERTLDG